MTFLRATQGLTQIKERGPQRYQNLSLSLLLSLSLSYSLSLSLTPSLTPSLTLSLTLSLSLLLSLLLSLSLSLSLTLSLTLSLSYSLLLSLTLSYSLLLSFVTASPNIAVNCDAETSELRVANYTTSGYWPHAASSRPAARPSGKYSPARSHIRGQEGAVNALPLPYHQRCQQGVPQKGRPSLDRGERGAVDAGRKVARPAWQGVELGAQRIAGESAGQRYPAQVLVGEQRLLRCPNLGVQQDLQQAVTDVRGLFVGAGTGIAAQNAHRARLVWAES